MAAEPTRKKKVSSIAALSFQKQKYAKGSASQLQAKCRSNEVQSLEELKTTAMHTETDPTLVGVLASYRSSDAGECSTGCY